MKSTINFIVSNITDFWRADNKKLLFIEPYLYYDYQKNLNRKPNKVTYIQKKTYTKSDLINDNKFINQKYKQYIKYLSYILNQIHRIKYSEKFWSTTFSLQLYRYILILKDYFEQFETHFNPNLHSINILDKNSYYTPIDFVDNNIFLCGDQLGFEQIFSIYIHCFYPHTFPTINYTPTPKLHKKSTSKEIYDFIHKIAKKTKTKLFNNKLQAELKTLMLGVYYNNRYHKKILGKRTFEIYDGIIYDFNDLNTLKIEEKLRTLVSNKGEADDRFDVFFYYSLQYLFPKVYLEGFQELKTKAFRVTNKYNSIKYILSENWIGNSKNAILIAFFKELGVKHINIEHNGHDYYTLNSRTQIISKLCDIYLTSGWIGYNAKFVPGAPHYFSTGLRKTRKKFKIVLISSVALIRRLHVGSMYSQMSGDNSEMYINNTRTILNNIDDNLKKHFWFKPYPKERNIGMISLDQLFLLKKELNGIKIIDEKVSTIDIYKKSELVIHDYIGSSYLESLIYNIPTIFFWNKKTFFLDDKYQNYFSNLIDAKICHTDIIDACEFIKSISVSPNSWWNNKKTQEARNNHLKLIFGDEDKFVDLLSDVCT